MLQSGTLSNVDHMPFAYRFRDEMGNKWENFDSDTDQFAGLQILKAMRLKSAENICVFVRHITSSQLSIKAKNKSLDQVTAGALLAYSNLEAQEMESATYPYRT